MSTIPDGTYGAGAAAEKSARGRNVCVRCTCCWIDVSRPEVYCIFEFLHLGQNFVFSPIVVCLFVVFIKSISI